MKKLRDYGHTTYLVGGSVRDILLKRIPKDFDISTSASPEEVKKIFKRNCLLIGKRFRLAHIRFGKNIIELATFRRGNLSDEELIIRDNEWGSEEEDVLRRDFTLNGLLYDTEKETLIDYVGGYEDLSQHLMRSIGDAHIRFKQDPVRMIRLLKFVARYDFQCSDNCWQALENNKEEIIKSSPARVLEEILRMCESGYAEPFFRLMYQHGFLKILMPNLDQFISLKKTDTALAYLKAADNLNSEEFINRSTLLACLFFPMIKDNVEKLIETEKIPHLGIISDLVQKTTFEAILDSFSHFPKKLRMVLNSTITHQYRLTPLQQTRFKYHKLIYNRDFKNILQFLKIRSLVDKDERIQKAYVTWSKRYKKVQETKEKSRKKHPVKTKKCTP